MKSTEEHTGAVLTLEEIAQADSRRLAQQEARKARRRRHASEPWGFATAGKRVRRRA